MAGPKEYIFKVVMLGDGSVGKTSLVLQFTERKFNENYIMSIGANFSIKMISMPEHNIAVRLQIWDLAGQQHFQFVRPSFYRGAFACIYVFDLTRRESFNNITNWVEEAEQYTPGVPRILLGNKLDLSKERVVSYSEGEKLAEEINAGYFETSAKEAKNVDACFDSLNDTLLKIHVWKNRR